MSGTEVLISCKPINTIKVVASLPFSRDIDPVASRCWRESCANSIMTTPEAAIGLLDQFILE